MTKRILEIITFPFYFIYLLISFPFKVLKIILDVRIEKKTKNSETNFKPNSNIELLEIGQLLFPNQYSEFELFFNSFQNDKKTFLIENKEFLKGYDNFELDKLKAIEVIYIFGDSKQAVWMTDWKGEENEREVETFLETKLQSKIDWIHVNKLREEINPPKKAGDFINNLLKTVDKDLEPINKKLVFFNLGWDAYIYTVADKTSFKSINSKFDALFHGTEELGK